MDEFVIYDSLRDKRLQVVLSNNEYCVNWVDNSLDITDIFDYWDIESISATVSELIKGNKFMDFANLYDVIYPKICKNIIELGIGDMWVVPVVEDLVDYMCDYNAAFRVYEL